MIEQADVYKYIQIVNTLKTESVFYDIHTHPFDVIFDQIPYHADKKTPGIFTTNGSRFIAPKLTDILIETDDYNNEYRSPNKVLQNNISRMFIQRLYSHTGPTVFSEHMGLSCIDKTLLLPVACSSGHIENQMVLMDQIYGKDNRFPKGTSVPNSIRNTKIHEFIKEMLQKFHIKAVKIHPNITGINLASPSGKKRIEAILSACGKLKLPLIIHGGKSHILSNLDASDYGCINNLKDINWSESKSTVVIAHAGGHGCTIYELQHSIIPKLKKMLSYHDNLMIDISALSVKALIAVFRSVESDRILFGSDALYQPQWSSVVKVMYALGKIFSNPEEIFIQIASKNPSNYIF